MPLRMMVTAQNITKQSRVIQCTTIKSNYAFYLLFQLNLTSL